MQSSSQRESIVTKRPTPASRNVRLMLVLLTYLLWQRHICVNNLPKVVTQHCHCAFNGSRSMTVGQWLPCCAGDSLPGAAIVWRHLVLNLLFVCWAHLPFDVDWDRLTCRHTERHCDAVTATETGHSGTLMQSDEWRVSFVWFLTVYDYPWNE